MQEKILVNPLSVYFLSYWKNCVFLMYIHLILDQDIENEVKHLEDLQSNINDVDEVLVTAAEIAKRLSLIFLHSVVDVMSY